MLEQRRVWGLLPSLRASAPLWFLRWSQGGRDDLQAQSRQHNLPLCSYSLNLQVQGVSKKFGNITHLAMVISFEMIQLHLIYSQADNMSARLVIDVVEVLATHSRIGQYMCLPYFFRGRM